MTVPPPTCFPQPVATALFANSPFKEGKPTGYLSWRSHVWTDTDPDRCATAAAAAAAVSWSQVSMGSGSSLGREAAGNRQSFDWKLGAALADPSGSLAPHGMPAAAARCPLFSRTGLALSGGCQQQNIQCCVAVFARWRGC